MDGSKTAHMRATTDAANLKKSYYNPHCQVKLFQFQVNLIWISYSSQVKRK